MQQINRRIALSAISGKAVARDVALAKRIATILWQNHQRKNLSAMDAANQLEINATIVQLNSRIRSIADARDGLLNRTEDAEE